MGGGGEGCGFETLSLSYHYQTNYTSQASAYTFLSGYTVSMWTDSRDPPERQELKGKLALLLNDLFNAELFPERY